MHIVLRFVGFYNLISFSGSILNVLLWGRYGKLWTFEEVLKVFEAVYGKNAVTHTFSEKAISRALCCYFLVDAALQMTLIKYLLSEATGRIDEKVTEETTDQNVSNAKFLITDAAHTPMTTPFLLLSSVLGHFLTYSMTLSVGQLDVRCALRLRLYLWGGKKSFAGNLVEVAILAVLIQYAFLILFFCGPFFSCFFFVFLFFLPCFFEKKCCFSYLFIHWFIYLFIYLFIHLFIGSDRPPYVSHSIIQQLFYEAS